MHTTVSKKSHFLLLVLAYILTVFCFVGLAGCGNDSGETYKQAIAAQEQQSSVDSSSERVNNLVDDESNAISEEKAIAFALRWLELFNEGKKLDAFTITALYGGYSEPVNADPAQVSIWTIYFEGSEGMSLWVPAYSGLINGENYGYGYREYRDFDLEGYLNYKGDNAKLDAFGRLFDLLDFDASIVFLIDVEAHSGEIVSCGFGPAKPSDTGMLTKEQAITCAIQYLNSSPFVNDIDWDNARVAALLDDYPGPINRSSWVIAFETTKAAPSWNVTGQGVLYVYINAYTGQMNGNAFHSNESLDNFSLARP